MCKYIGIDVSKLTFDTAFVENSKWTFKQYPNTTEGFKELATLLQESDWIILEASGPYYLRLASYFHDLGINVSVLNPLIIKRYSQANLYRAKTDKKDAKIIAEYANHFELKQWKPDSKINVQVKQMYTRVELLNKQLHQNNMQLEAFLETGLLSKELKREIEKNIKHIKASIEKLEAKMEEILQKECGDTLKRLQTIPAIGIKSAILLTIITDNFTKFENAKQLTAYVGFSPRVYQSGTSVRGKGHICKMGSSQVRKVLYMCSLTAKKYNKSCKEMWERLEERGKPHRVMKIAIANKLLRQAFSVGKNKTIYDKNFA